MNRIDDSEVVVTITLLQKSGRSLVVNFRFNHIVHCNGRETLCSSLLRAHLRVDGLDVLPLGNGTLVASQAPLGEFVNPLVGGRASRLDHIENSPLVRRETGHLTGDLAAEGGALAELLFGRKDESNVSVS